MCDLIIIHGADMIETAEELQSRLLAEGILSLTFSEVLLQGPLNIPELVGSAVGIVIILSGGLLSDMTGLTAAKLAMSSQKAVCVRFDASPLPAWAGKPFNLAPDHLFEVQWGLFMTLIRTYVNIAGLADFGLPDQVADDFSSGDTQPGPDMGGLGSELV